MKFLQSVSMLRSAALRPANRCTAPRARFQVRFATSDYDSGKGNPVGERPEKQGQNPSEHLEHPGPAPPKVAQGKSSSSPNKDSNSNQNDFPTSTSDSSASSSSKGSSGKREFSTSASRKKNEKEPAVSQGQQNKPKPSEVKGAQPKILNVNPPAPGEESQEVKEHNEDMSKRAEQAHEKIDNQDAEKDKVPTTYWKGQGGRIG